MNVSYKLRKMLGLLVLRLQVIGTERWDWKLLDIKGYKLENWVIYFPESYCLRFH